MALTKINYAGQGVVPHAKMPSGTVLQTVTHSWNTQFDYGTLSDADVTGSNFDITPKFSNSKIIINYCVSLSYYDTQGGVDIGAMYYVRYGSTDINKPTGNYQNYIDNSSNLATIQNLTVEISPNSTSQATIKLRARPYSTHDTIRFNEGAKFYSTAQAMEIAG